MKKGLLLTCLSLGIAWFGMAQQTPSSPDDSTVVKELIGKYTFPEGSVIADVTVNLENGALTMASSAGVSSLEKQNEDLYTIVQFQGTAKFNRNSDKKVIGVSIVAMGYVLEGVKVSGSTVAQAVPLRK